MKRLEVTDEQYAFIQQLREEMSGAIVGRYGFVRERDAVQFLIDNLDDDTDVDVDAEIESGATADVAASVDAAVNDEPDPHALEEKRSITYDEGLETDDEGLESDDGPSSDETGGNEGEDGGDESEDQGDGETDGTDADGDDGAADDDDMLNQMMNLLDTHDDKWEESPSADYRYRVTLPDGTTEDVQTKDDVRAILFKNY